MEYGYVHRIYDNAINFIFYINMKSYLKYKGKEIGRKICCQNDFVFLRIFVYQSSISFLLKLNARKPFQKYFPELYIIRVYVSFYCDL